MLRVELCWKVVCAYNDTCMLRAWPVDQVPHVMSSLRAFECHMQVERACCELVERELTQPQGVQELGLFNLSRMMGTWRRNWTTFPAVDGQWVNYTLYPAVVKPSDTRCTVCEMQRKAQEMVQRVATVNASIVQLLVDDYAIASMHNAERVFERASKTMNAGQPVLRCDRAWESKASASSLRSSDCH